VHTFGKKFYIIIEGKVSILIPFTNSDGEIDMKNVARLDNGMAFGELALIKDQPRAASVLCETDCHFAVLSKEDYLNIIGKIEARKLDVFIEFLSFIPTFRTWTKKKLELLTYHFTKVDFKRKQDVFTIGSPPENVYIVVEGEFELWKPMAAKTFRDKTENFILKFALLGRGEVFGDEEVLNDRSHSMICTCYTTTGKLLAIKAEDFRMKVTEDFAEIFKNKEKTKNVMRGLRIENFRNYITRFKPNDHQQDKKITYSKPFYINKLRPKSELGGRSVKKLTSQELEKIKKRALGRDLCFEEFLNLSIRKQLEEKYGGFDASERTDKISQQITDRSSLDLVMKSHRPGGYYRGNLKKMSNGRSSSIR
jgi:CRP-like cAMP-binding protein